MGTRQEFIPCNAFSTERRHGGSITGEVMPWAHRDIIWQHYVLYRVSHKKRNARISLLWNSKIWHILISSDNTLSSEKNDTKIIWFGLVVLILQPFLETQSFTNLFNLHELFTVGIAVHKSGQQCMEVTKAIIPAWNVTRMKRNWQWPCFEKWP